MSKRKVTPEEEIEAVERYLGGELRLSEVIERYGISKAAVLDWVALGGIKE